MRSEQRTLAMLLVGLMVIGVVCVACAGASVGARQAGLPVDPPFGYAVDLCVGVGPRQVGLTWASIYFSARPLFPFVNAVCGFVPWLPGLPQRGLFVFP